MSVLRNLFGKKDEPIKSYADFWNWFQQNEKAFFNIIKKHKNIEKGFFGKLSPKLDELKDGIYFMAGMFGENTAELVLTPDGIIKNIVFIEELVDAAPQIEGWKFTALKPPLDIENVGIEMGGYEFNGENLHFYSNDHSDYPDEIDITIVSKDLNEENESPITHGTFIFLDNYLGELNFISTIDNLNIVSESNAQGDLIPIGKLKDFLIWRQKEFIEKYEGVRHDTESDSYSILEAELKSGNMLIAVLNTTLLDWEGKASHPWILTIEIKYDGEINNGMPDAETLVILDEIEGEFLDELKDFEGYLNIGRQTADGVRELYFACKDFRKPSKVSFKIQSKYGANIEMDYKIYIDKYWQSFNRFRTR